MGTAITDVEKPVRPPLWIRLRSWKWWVYGDVHSKPLDKLPKWCTTQLVVTIFLWCLLCGHPWWVTWINRHPPTFSELQTVQGVVVRTSSKNPQITLKLSDGRSLDLEFPAFLGTYGRSSAGPASLGPNNERVHDCHAIVWFDKPRYTLWNRYRIWQIRCEDRNTFATFGEIVRTADIDLFYSGLFIFFLIPLGLARVILRTRRGYYGID